MKKPKGVFISRAIYAKKERKITINTKKTREFDKKKAEEGRKKGGNANWAYKVQNQSN